MNTLVLEKIYKLSNEEEREIDKVVKEYKKVFYKDTKTKFKILDETPLKYFEDELDENNRLFLISIKIKDFSTDKKKTIDVFVDFTKDHINKGEFIDEDQIFLYYYNLGFKDSEVKDVVVHEILHGKQQYKKMSKKYIKAIKKRKLPGGESTFRSNRDYYLDPLEMPVYTTLIIRQLLSEYKESEKPEKIKLKKFLADFIKTGAKVNIANKNTPDIILDKSQFFYILYRNRNNKKYRPIYKSFLKKLYWLYSKLK